jgi:soluble lytic murein transglycosylase
MNEIQQSDHSAGRRSTGYVRVLVLGLSALTLTCHANADPPSVASAPTAGAEREPSVDRGPFSPERARPLHAEARALLESSPSAALAALEGLSDEEASWLRAEAEQALDHDDARIAALEAVIAFEGPLAPWARLELAAAAPARAAEVLAPLAGLDWAGRSDARLALALADVDLQPLTTFVADEPRSSRARRALADRLADAEAVEAREVALSHYRYLEAAGASREIEARIETILASLPRERREALDAASLEDRLARAEVIAASHRHEDGEAAFAAVVRAARGDDAHSIRCRAELGVGRARYRRRARREAIETLDAMADRCRDVPEAGAWGRYFAAKSYANLDERHDSVARWDALATEYPDHSLADDARVEAARMLMRMGDLDGARDRLALAIALAGDLRGEARFVLAWILRSRGHFSEALAELDASLAEGPGESAEDLRGRAAYWRGEVLTSLGHSDDALTAWADLANGDPLAYYAQQARARVAAIDGARLADLRGTADFEVHPDVTSGPALDRALALLRVGESARAISELEAIGALSDDASSETLWWVAALFDRSGAHHRAVELTRRRLQRSLATASSDARFGALVDIAYPRAYGPLITGAAGTESIPASLVFAIAREESSFEPRAVSGAHAYGMLQIIRSTARPIATRLGLPSDVHALARPDVSVRIGAHYLSNLSRRYESNPSVVPAAYNAGQGAVDRWLTQNGSLPLDAWIEEIPYGETRRYTRRVLMSQGIYEWRTTGSFPALPSVLPRRS